MHYIPIGPFKKGPQTKVSTLPTSEHIRIEFELLRHLSGGEASAPFVEQGMSYFSEIGKASWRAAGLLHYYAFLNIAKALLVQSGVGVDSSIKKNIMHGIRGKNPVPDNLEDMEIRIEANSDGRSAFAQLYEFVTKGPWPFNKEVSIKMSSLFAFSEEIGDEVVQLLAIEPLAFPAHSLVSFTGSDAQFKFIVPKQLEDTVSKDVAGWATPLSAAKVGADELNAWQAVMDKTLFEVAECTVFHGPVYSYKKGELFEGINAANDNAIDALKDFATMNVYPFPNAQTWTYCSRLKIESTQIKWHPVLADYLIAFGLSHVLRYHPNAISERKKSQFLAEAWCRQAGNSVMRHFLAMKQPPVRIQQRL